ncbi:hypothetical protein FOA52_015408 [Chlamydomonas sp. UWO 241]|nr:hypothetical protein FOA52_015408 [Chlamydomonas sp. UWO 241]
MAATAAVPTTSLAAFSDDGDEALLLGGSSPAKQGAPGSSAAAKSGSPSTRTRPSFEIESGLDPRARCTAGSGSFRHPFGIWKRRYITGVFTLLGALLFMDQNLLAPNLSMAAAFFGLDDAQKDEYLGGYVSAAFFAVGAPAALLVGWYTDKVNRKYLLFAVCAAGQIPTLLTGLVTQYWQFLVLRVFTGIAIGGAFPLLYSLMGDLFPVSQRAFVSAFIQAAAGAGVFLGQMLAAWLGPATGDWRVPFVVVAVPSLCASVLMLVTCSEPPRGACEEALQDLHDEGTVYTEQITWRKAWEVCKVPSNILIFAQGLPGSIPWGMIMTFLNDYLQLEDGLSPAAATSVITFFGLGAGVGVFAGGAAGQALYNRRKEWMPLFSGGCVLLGIFPLMYIINVRFENVALACALAACAGLVASVAGPNVKAITINVNDPESRGVALALQTMTDDLGKALGPFIVATFIKFVGRQGAFNMAVLGWIPCGLMLMAMAMWITRDEEAMQGRLKRKASTLTTAAQGASSTSLLPRGGALSDAFDDYDDDDDYVDASIFNRGDGASGGRGGSTGGGFSGRGDGGGGGASRGGGGSGPTSNGRGGGANGGGRGGSGDSGGSGGGANGKSGGVPNGARNDGDADGGGALLAASGGAGSHASPPARPFAPAANKAVFTLDEDMD